MDWDRVVSTENVSKKQSEPKIMDWNPVINGETRKAKFGHIKTIPKFERAPSHHKPIFSGQLDLKSRSTSSFKGPIRLKSSSTTSLSSGPLNLKSPSTTSFLSSFNSLLEQSQYDYEETEITYVPETPPVRINIFIYFFELIFFFKISRHLLWVISQILIQLDLL
jgi:hypothetical protein